MRATYTLNWSFHPTGTAYQDQFGRIRTLTKGIGQKIDKSEALASKLLLKVNRREATELFG